MNTQDSKNVFVFDMDNTLIKTDKANSLAYVEAIEKVLGDEYDVRNVGRITRNRLKDIFPDLTEKQYEEIIACKEKCFDAYIGETELNKKLFMLLKRLYKKGCQTILLTNSRSGRAISLCNHYGLTRYFIRRFFFEDCPDNKYMILKVLGFDLQNVVLYENEETSSSDAVANGIMPEKIIKVEF